MLNFDGYFLKYLLGVIGKTLEPLNLTIQGDPMLSSLVLRRITISVLGMLSAAASQAGSYNLTSDTWLQGIQFKTGTNLTTQVVNGVPIPEKGTLAQQYTANNVTWEAGKIVIFDSRMNVIEGTVANGKYGRYDLAPSTTLNIYANGAATQATFITEVPLTQYSSSITAKTPINFYQNGSVRSAQTNSSITFTTIQGLKKYNLASGVYQFWPAPDADQGAGFLKVGAVKQAKLDGDHVHLLEILPTGATVGFDGAGNLNLLQCPNTCSYKLIPMNGGGLVEILPQGNFTLIGNQSVTVGGKTYQAGQKLLLSPEANVISASQ